MSDSDPERLLGHSTEFEQAQTDFFKCLMQQTNRAEHVDGVVNRVGVDPACSSAVFARLDASPLADLILPRGAVVGYDRPYVYTHYSLEAEWVDVLAVCAVRSAPTILRGESGLMRCYWSLPNHNVPYFLGVASHDCQPSFEYEHGRTVSQLIGVALDREGRPTAMRRIRVDTVEQPQHCERRDGTMADMNFIVDLFNQLA